VNIRNFESNRIVTKVFDSKRAQLFEIFEYLPSPIFLFISSRLTDYRQKYRLPVTLFNYRLSIYRVKHACAHAGRSMYLISAAYHTSVKRCRRPCRLHTCAVDGGGVGTHICKANTCCGCGRQRMKSRLNGTDVNYITTALRLPGR